MNFFNVLRANLFALCGICLISSCDNTDILGDEDDISVLDGNQRVNKWIHSTMKSNYYWLDEIDSFNKYNIDANPDAFFSSLISSNEKKKVVSGDNEYIYYYSYIINNNKTKASNQKEYTYGIEFITYSISNQSRYEARVMYVLPGSPAEKAGLKRGMWIGKINNSYINDISILNSLYSGGELVLEVEDYRNVYFGEAETPEVKSLTVSGAIEMYNNPILKDTVFSLENENVGYLAYNHFTTGPNSFENKQFDDELVDVFRKFHASEVSKLIIDLRYNPGGYLDCCRHLASLMARKEDSNEIFCKVTHNSASGYSPSIYKIQDKSTSNVDISSIKLNTTDLYFITGQYSASASEALINGFKAFDGINVISVGMTTEGKNLASNNFRNDDLGWELQPITGKVSNKNDNSDYFNGLKPTYELDEFNTKEYGYYWGDFGTKDDGLINFVINKITNTEEEPETKSSVKKLFKTDAIKKNSSIERRKFNTCILDPYFIQ